MKIHKVAKSCIPSALILASMLVHGQTTKPNILFILTDDLGYNDLGCYGNSFYETPNIDKLCKEGMKFNQHYAAAAISSPTRSSIITGKYPARTHTTEVFNWGITKVFEKEPLLCEKDTMINHNQPFLANEIRKQGYKTCMYGKWHIGGIYPGKTGFDQFVVTDQSTVEGSDANADEFHTTQINKLTTSFIENCVSNKKPFFAVVSYHSVHEPIASTTANRVYFEQKGALPEWKKRPKLQNPIYAGMVKDLDAGVGELLAKLDQLGITDNTIVVFTSDNGGLGERNFPLRAGKSQEWEGGVRVPLIARWPNSVQAGSTTNHVAVSTDYFPTFVNIAGATVAAGVAPDGESFLPILLGKNQADRSSIIFHFPHYRDVDGQSWNRPWSLIRKGDFSYIYHWEGELNPNCAVGPNTSNELYDVISDPGQTKNIVKSNKSKAKELKAELLNWLKTNNAQIPSVNPEYIRKD